jgi:hypothetical protein
VKGAADIHDIGVHQSNPHFIQLLKKPFIRKGLPKLKRMRLGNDESLDGVPDLLGNFGERRGPFHKERFGRPPAGSKVR